MQANAESDASRCRRFRWFAGGLELAEAIVHAELESLLVDVNEAEEGRRSRCRIGAGRIADCG